MSPGDTPTGTIAVLVDNVREELLYTFTVDDPTSTLGLSLRNFHYRFPLSRHIGSERPEYPEFLAQFRTGLADNVKFETPREDWDADEAYVFAMDNAIGELNAIVLEHPDETTGIRVARCQAGPERTLRAATFGIGYTRTLEERFQGLPLPYFVSPGLRDIPSAVRLPGLLGNVLISGPHVTDEWVRWDYHMKASPTYEDRRDRAKLGLGAIIQQVRRFEAGEHGSQDRLALQLRREFTEYPWNFAYAVDFEKPGTRQRFEEHVEELMTGSFPRIILAKDLLGSTALEKRSGDFKAGGSDEAAFRILYGHS